MDESEEAATVKSGCSFCGEPDPGKKCSKNHPRCKGKLFCKKNRERLFRERAKSLFEDKLDIRSFVKMQASLSLALSLLFTKEQAHLFKHSRARAISQKLESGDPSESKQSEQYRMKAVTEDDLVPEDNKESLDKLTGITISDSTINQQLLVGIILGINIQNFTKKIEAHQVQMVNNIGESVN